NTANGTYLLPPVFSATITGNSQGYPVHGCARYTVRMVQMAALWAGGTTADRTLYINANTTINGLIHSNNDILVHGHSVLSGPIEYVSTVDIDSNTTAPSPTRVAATTMAAIADVADYRPGGKVANAAAGTYHDMSALCSNGTWKAKASDIPAGIVYANCIIEVDTSDAPIGATPVAEGDLVIKATGLTITAAPGLPALISNATDATAINEKGGSGV